jgi:hypothetical protein
MPFFETLSLIAAPNLLGTEKPLCFVQVVDKVKSKDPSSSTLENGFGGSHCYLKTASGQEAVPHPRLSSEW